jgi:hypothetical protein
MFLIFRVLAAKPRLQHLFFILYPVVIGNNHQNSCNYKNDDILHGNACSCPYKYSAEITGMPDDFIRAFCNYRLCSTVANVLV